jgi:hypothetical protein
LAKKSLNVKILECDQLYLCALNEETYFSYNLRCVFSKKVRINLKKVSSKSLQIAKIYLPKNDK